MQPTRRTTLLRTIMLRTLLPCACFALVLIPRPAHAFEFVLRDSIGPDSSLTDGWPGASTINIGSAVWATPGMVVDLSGIVDVSETGILAEMKTVIFAFDINASPENVLANVEGLEMDFHLWSEGIFGGPGSDSFEANAVGAAVPGHTLIEVNRLGASFITVEEFGITGPGGNPSMFTTFLVTVDLSSFEIELEGDQEYVVAITNPGGKNFVTGGGTFRHIYSSSTGFEDLYQQFDTPIGDLPGFVSSQHGFAQEQFAGFVSIDVPVLGDMNGDDTVTLADVPWFVQALTDRAAYDAHNFATAGGFAIDAEISGDVNMDGTFDTGDLCALRDLFAPPEPIVGDMNGDGVVNLDDISLFVLALVDPTGYDALCPSLDREILGDVNVDGTFDTGDLGAFSALLGGPASAASVPEPSAWFLSLFALAGVMGRRI